jgi:hypothetical protein
MAKELITATRLREILSYEPDTGVLAWRVSGRGRKPCGVAGTPCRGYTHVKVDGGQYLAHRLAWLYMTGEWPPDQIDHVSGDRADNRWLNLRLADNSKNRANTGRSVVNTSGLKGVSWDKARHKWRADIKVHGKSSNLGCFGCKADAALAYDRSAILFSGPFARLNFSPEENAGRRVLSDRVISKLIIAKLKDWAREVATIQSDEPA